jgi:hypothetical protein
LSDDLTTWRRGDWMQTYTGKKFYPMDPQVEDVDILDIAHSLSMQCRYNGHVDQFYSVAEHCVLMSNWIEEEYWDAEGGGGLPLLEVLELSLWALLHDAPEAYIGDMIRPVKLHMPEFCDLDDRIMSVIATKFNLPESPAGPGKLPEVVKEADTRILLAERQALMKAPPGSWGIAADPIPVLIMPMSPTQAKSLYMTRFSYLQDAIEHAKKDS